MIGLDDLVNDHLKENKKLELKSKRAKARKDYFSDEDDDIREAKLSECVEKCQQEALCLLCFFPLRIYYIAYCLIGSLTTNLYCFL